VVKIEIDDETWDLWKWSWALFDVTGDDKLVEYLKQWIRESSMDVLNDAEKHSASCRG